MEISYHINDIDAIAQQLLQQLESKVILFNAPMGAGKTTLIAAICKQLGITNKISSPTFSIVNEYKGKDHEVMHFDLYRLENQDQLYDLGFEDYLNNNAFLFIEWPTFALTFLDDYQELSIEIISDDERTLHLNPLKTF
jgi:tRNA threonylcarbamoyladenosine biosynthesis protein TsaE